MPAVEPVRTATPVPTTAEIHDALIRLGVWQDGETYTKAVMDFQKVQGLKVDGIVGPKTLAELFPAPIPGRSFEQKDPAPKVGWPRQSQVFGFYGPVGQNQVTLRLPWPMKLAWDTKKVVTKFSLHEKVHDSALRVFNRIGDAYNADQRALLGLDLFGGCLNVRKMRGGSSWSMHAWGIAIDFDPARNQLKWNKAQARLAKTDCQLFWRLWEEEGWLSLGRARDYDWMHVQAAKL